MTMITPSYLGETIEYSSLHACRSTLEDPTRIHAGPLRLDSDVQNLACVFNQAAHRGLIAALSPRLSDLPDGLIPCRLTWS